MMQLLVVGLSHKTAPLDLREQFAISPDALESAARRIRDAVGAESFIISTCNRVEVYASASETASASDHIKRALAASASLPGAGLEPHLYTHSGEEAVRHLFRVAASLVGVGG